MNTNYSTNLDVILIGYENQENIGLRSIMSYLQSKNYDVLLIPFSRNNWTRIKSLSRKYKPIIIGFSIIFQYTLKEFGKLSKYLRKQGITSHFTAGGHFPTVQPKQSLYFVPELDSIVRHEGEQTIVELIEHLKNNKPLYDIKGLAFRDNAEVVINESRELINDLDSLPPIYRDQPKTTNYGVRTASILASRGCYYNCSFCSIRKFYGSTKGLLRRTRSPKSVVDEIKNLYVESNVTFFAFQDDDFSVKNKVEKEWLKQFMNELLKAGLYNKIKWKISCRVDDINTEIIEQMKQHGLFAVYMGVESGNTLGLKTLNKKVSVSQNLNAIRIIKDFDLALSIGFMLFDPNSTFSTVKENLLFLSEIGEDGYFPINFCKMLPYAGTQIQEELVRQHKLTGTIIEPDYELLDHQLEWYSFIVNRIFKQRNFNDHGLVQRLNELDLCIRLLSLKDDTNYLNEKNYLKEITRRDNLLTVNTLFELINQFEKSDYKTLLRSQKEIIQIAEKVWRDEASIINQVECLEKKIICTHDY